MNETKQNLIDQLTEIRRMIKQCETNALRFYDDSAEVSLQWAYADELELEARSIEARLYDMHLAETFAEKESE